MIKRICLVFLCISASSCGSNDKKLVVDPEIVTLEEGFIERYSRGTGDAIDFLASTSKWIAPDDMTFLKDKLDSIKPQLGQFHGFVLIAFRSVSDDFVLRSYLAKYERQPLRFNLTFYRPTVKWQLHYIECDFEIDDELKESARAYRLNRNLIFEDHE